MYEILFLIAGALLIWWAITIIRRNPNLFTKANFSQTLTTVGLLTLLIIAIVFIAVKILKM